MDIAERLNDHAEFCDKVKRFADADCYRKGAEEIARLRAELDAVTMELATAVQSVESARVDAEKAIIDVAIKALTQGYYSGRIVTGAGVTSLSARQWAADFAESAPLFKDWIDAAIDAARGGK